MKDVKSFISTSLNIRPPRGQPAVDRGVSRRHRPTLSDPRPGFDLWTRFSAAGSWNADRRSDHRSPLALAKSLLGTNNRQYPSRMSRPRDCTFRRASSKNSKEVFSLLPQFQTTSSARSERSHPTNRRIWKERPGYLNSRGRWPASSVSASSLKPAQLICSRILIDGRSSRKHRLGAIRLILLNRPNGPPRKDGRILRRFVCPKE
jgi:hypothetical protein